MSVLHTLAYPVLSADDARWIEAFRRRHDPQSGVVDAHFTLVFGCADVAADTYLAHVEAISRRTRPIRFVCRYAMPAADKEAGTAHVFLVPDEGHSGLSRLHDTLYTGPLARLLRLDIPYVPHITLGASNDPAAAKRLCDDLNTRGLAVYGAVEALTVVALEEGRIRPLGTFELAAVAP